tara:strand:+ start:1806 stop:1913 length:108 start_codon:yes stop_codon:yes gene_type:complete
MCGFVVYSELMEVGAGVFGVRGEEAIWKPASSKYV